MTSSPAAGRSTGSVHPLNGINDTMGFGKDGKGVIIREFRTQALGALAGSAGIIIGTNLNTLERFRMLKAELQVVVVAVTGNEGAGMSLFLVDGEFTLTQFEAAMELTSGPLGPNEAPDAAIAERFMVWAGMTVSDETGTEVPLINDMGGPLLTVKPRWTFARAKSWNWILYNHGTTLTTGATVKLFAKDFGVWVT